MRHIIYILTLCLGFIFGCNHADKTANLNRTSRLLPESDIGERLRYQKRIIDTEFNHSKTKLIVLVKLADNDELVRVTNEEFPEDIETTFNIFEDSLGQVITISEFPFSRSGDWYISLTHYFDKDERTFAFEKQTNFFNSICTDGAAYETKTEFYNSDFQLIDKEYKLVDKENKPLQMDSCGFPYDYGYKVLADIDECFGTYKIKNIH
jgi:hypothetical protein